MKSEAIKNKDYSKMVGLDLTHYKEDDIGMSTIPNKLYRAEYNVIHYSDYNSIYEITIIEIYLIKKTPKGGWYSEDQECNNGRWIADKGRKKYAYHSIKEALESLIIRKKKHIKHLQREESDMQQVLKKAIKQYENLS